MKTETQSLDIYLFLVELCGFRAQCLGEFCAQCLGECWSCLVCGGQGCKPVKDTHTKSQKKLNQTSTEQCQL